MPTRRSATAAAKAAADNLIAFQGAHGAYSDMACRAAFPRRSGSGKVPPVHSRAVSQGIP